MNFHSAHTLEFSLAHTRDFSAAQTPEFSAAHTRDFSAAHTREVSFCSGLDGLRHLYEEERTLELVQQVVGVERLFRSTCSYNAAYFNLSNQIELRFENKSAFRRGGVASQGKRPKT